MKNKDAIIEKRKKLCAELRKIRTDRGLMLQDVADDIGILYQTVAKIENGQWSVGIDQILQLCEYYGVEVEINK